jgi:hypothetical protein
MKLYTTVLFLLASSVLGQTLPQTLEVKDKNGVTVIKIEDVKLSRYSDYFKEEIPIFRGMVHNVSGSRLLTLSVVGSIHTKNGNAFEFTLDSICKSSLACDLDKDAVVEATYSFSQPWKFMPPDIESVELVLKKGQRLVGKEGYHVSGFIAKDQGCLNDYVSATTLSGLALRKKMAELLEFGCGFVVDKPLQALLTDNDIKILKSASKSKTTGLRVGLLDERIFLGIEPSPHNLESGWVAIGALEPGLVLCTESIGIEE